MKVTVLYLLVSFLTLFSCNSQEVKQNKKDKPHEKVSVNRKYDENGNLIEFDSTYTSYYSNVNGDTLQIDSLLNGFPSFFNDEFFNFNSKNLYNSFFDNDSVLNPHFFNEDFFEQQFFNQNADMLKMIQNMDSIKNTFFERHWKTIK